MKYLEKYDIITYDDERRYVVIDSIIEDDKNFVYLLQLDDPTKQFFALVSKENERIKVDELDPTATENKDIFKKLLVELTVDMHKFLNERGVLINEG